eukprot:RCo051230
MDRLALRFRGPLCARCCAKPRCLPKRTSRWSSVFTGVKSFAPPVSTYMDPPEGYKVMPASGRQCMLKAVYADVEVRVSFALPSRLRLKAATQTLRVPFDVFLLRPQRGAIVAKCVALEHGAFDISDVIFIPEEDKGLLLDPTPSSIFQLNSRYLGPNLDFMTDFFLDSWVQYLDSLGVNPTLCRFVQQHVMLHRLPLEFIRWRRTYDCLIGGQVGSCPS